jgi:hypothetical protein
MGPAPTLTPPSMGGGEALRLPATGRTEEKCNTVIHLIPGTYRTIIRLQPSLLPCEYQ